MRVNPHKIRLNQTLENLEKLKIPVWMQGTFVGHQLSFLMNLLYLLENLYRDKEWVLYPLHSFTHN